MKSEAQLINIIWKLVKGFRHGSIQSIDLLAYSVVFQKVGGSWGVWSQGAFVPMSEDHDDALWLAVEWAMDAGRFNLLIDKINCQD